MKNKTIDFMHFSRKIKDLERYSNNPFVKKKDTVASHSWRSALLGILFESINKDTGLDFKKIIYMLILHDLVEFTNSEVTALGFRNRLFKAKSEEEALLQLKDLFPEDQFENIHNLLAEFVNQKSPEAKLAKAIENYESNLHVIEEKQPLLDPTHKELTINYIKRRLGLNKSFDDLINDQLGEIEEVSKQLKL